MANAVVSLRIMPESPEVDLQILETEIKQKITDFAGEGEMRITVQPIAFGLKALDIIFVMDEKKGSTEPLEQALSTIDGVNSAEVTDVRRAIG